jgi:hypothetical protein
LISSTCPCRTSPLPRVRFTISAYFGNWGAGAGGGAGGQILEGKGQGGEGKRGRWGVWG